MKFIAFQTEFRPALPVVCDAIMNQGAAIRCDQHYFDFVLNIEYADYKLGAGGSSVWLRQQ